MVPHTQTGGLLLPYCPTFLYLQDNYYTLEETSWFNFSSLKWTSSISINLSVNTSLYILLKYKGHFFFPNTAMVSFIITSKILNHNSSITSTVSIQISVSALYIFLNVYLNSGTQIRITHYWPAWISKIFLCPPSLFEICLLKQTRLSNSFLTFWF